MIYAIEWSDNVLYLRCVLWSSDINLEIIIWRWLLAVWFQLCKDVQTNVPSGLNPHWAHFTGLLFPSLSLWAELHNNKALIWKSTPHTRLSQQHTGFHYLEQVAFAGWSKTLKMKVGGFGGPRRLPVSCQKVNLSVFHCSCPDNPDTISFSLCCLTPFPLIS